MLRQEVGLLLKNRRKELGISTDSLVAIAGVSRRNLFYIEEGIANPSLETLTKLLDVLGLELKIVVRDEATG